MDAEGFWERLKEEGSLSPGLYEVFLSLYGDRGQRALEALEHRKVRKYRDFVVVLGSSHEYVVEPDFCTCQDFLFRGRCCWHVLAARLADACGSYEVFDQWYQDSWMK